MKGVGAVILGERVLLAVERELGLGDPVGHPAADRPKIWVAAEIAFEIVKTENDVVDLAVSVGYMQLRDNSAVRDDLSLHPRRVGENKEIHGFAVFGLAEVHLLDACLHFLLSSRCCR